MKRLVFVAALVAAGCAPAATSPPSDGLSPSPRTVALLAAVPPLAENPGWSIVDDANGERVDDLHGEVVEYVPVVSPVAGPVQVAWESRSGGDATSLTDPGAFPMTVDYGAGEARITVRPGERCDGVTLAVLDREGATAGYVNVFLGCTTATT